MTAVHPTGPDKTGGAHTSQAVVAELRDTYL